MSALQNIFPLLTAPATLRNMVIGAVVGLVLISLLVFSIDNPDPAWGPNWRLRPLIITPLAAALGALAFCLKDLVKPETFPARLLVFLLSAVGFVVAFWLGTVLGLDGTLWN